MIKNLFFIFLFFTPLLYGMSVPKKTETSHAHIRYCPCQDAQRFLNAVTENRCNDLCAVYIKLQDKLDEMANQTCLCGKKEEVVKALNAALTQISGKLEPVFNI